MAPRLHLSRGAMVHLKVYPLRPARPERVCWGCERLCPAKDMACGNGKGRTEHPSELFGDDWYVQVPLTRSDETR